MESHRPFEDWLLGDDALNSLQRSQLKAHLDTCIQCQDLAAGWSAVERAVRDSRWIAPAPGFKARWLTGLPERQAKQARRQAWWIGLGLAGAAAIVGALLLVLVGHTLLSPWAWIVQGLNVVTDLAVWGWVVWGFCAAVVDGLPSIVPAAWGVGLVAACLGLVGLWLISLYRLAAQGVTKGESR